MERLKILMVTRNTLQESLVFEAVNELHNHATADEIYELIVKKYPGISKGTVYRNLNKLDRQNRIHKLEMPDGADRFDHCCHEHYHIKCGKCGRVFDVDMDAVEDLRQRIKTTHGFEFTGYDIIFKGFCPECNK